MQQFQLGNFLKIKQQIEQKLSAIEKLKEKITTMDKKLLYQGYQKLNSVMMRKVEIKHTSQFMLKLNDEYFAQVKSSTVLENLQRKQKNYDENLKKVNHKIQQLEKKIKKSQNQKNQNDLLENYEKSAMEVIGTNEEGQSIFNIIQVQGEEDTDISQLSNNNKNQPQQRDSRLSSQKEPVQEKPISTENPIVKNAQASKVQTIKSKESSQNQQEVGEDDLLLDYNNGKKEYSEDQLSDIDEEQSDEEKTQNIKIPQKQLIEKKQIIKNVVKNVQKPKQEKINIINKSEPAKSTEQNKQQTKQKQEKAQSKAQTKQMPKKQDQKKSTPVVKQQPAKPISKFKLERMKQKLEENL